MMPLYGDVCPYSSQPKDNADNTSSPCAVAPAVASGSTLLDQSAKQQWVVYEPNKIFLLFIVHRFKHFFFPNTWQYFVT